MEQTQLQLSRTPKALPQMKINPEITELFDFRYEDFELVNYDPYPAIRAAVSI